MHNLRLEAGRNIANTGNVTLRDDIGNEVATVYSARWGYGHKATDAEAKAIADRIAASVNAVPALVAALQGLVGAIRFTEAGHCRVEARDIAARHAAAVNALRAAGGEV